MHAATWGKLGRRHIAEPHVLRAGELRRAIDAARYLTARVKDHWFELSPEERTQAIQVVDWLDELQRVEAEARTSRTRNLVHAVWTGVRAFVATTLSHGANSALVFIFAKEALTLGNAVRTRLAQERRAERELLDDALAQGPGFVGEAELEKASRDYANGRFVAITATELRERAAEKARAEQGPRMQA